MPGTGGSSGSVDNPSAGNGSMPTAGSPASGGQPSTGDAGATSSVAGQSSGGAPAAGGAPASAGTPGMGGAPAAGGTSGAGPVAGAGGSTTVAACPKPTGQICHEFFANDNSRNELHYVNEFTPSKNWTVKVGDSGQNSPRAIQVVDSTKGSGGKAVMVSIDKGFAEFDMATGALLNKVATFSGITSALRIPAGTTGSVPAGTTVLLSPTQLAYVSPTGAAALPTVNMSFAAAGAEIRKLERNPANGHFSFTKFESSTAAYVYEVTELGASVAKIKLPAGAKGYNAIWVDGGKMQVSTGEKASVITIDATGAVSATLGGVNTVKDSTGAIVYTDFFSGFFRLPNGNVVAANWLGHQNPALHPNTPELLEFSPANQLVWSWGNQMLATFITYGYFLR